MPLKVMANDTKFVNPMEENILKEQGTNYTSKCGKSVVRLVNVLDSGDDFSFRLDTDGTVIVRTMKERMYELDLKKTKVLMDVNSVACVTNDKNTFLLIWSFCTGVVCDWVNFYKIDLDKLQPVFLGDNIRDVSKKLKIDLSKYKIFDSYK